MRTIFVKQLVLYLTILAVSFALLGAVLSQAIRQYFTGRQVDFLTDAAVRSGAVLEAEVRYGILNISRLYNQAVQIQQYLRADVIVIDTQYRVLAYAGGLEEIGPSFYAEDFEALMAGEPVVVVYGNPQNLYQEPRLTVGCPVSVDGTVMCAVLVSTSMAELEATISGMYRVTLLCLALCMSLACVLVYFSSRAISRPLRQMNEAAGVIAAGDFEKRIAVKSRDEVGQLAQRFNHMAESLEEQEKIRRAFIANISHDLRSPLTSMRGFLQAIGDGTVPPEKRPYYMNIVLDESERLIKLSNDLLNIQRIQSPELTLNRTDFDINALIRRTVLSFEQIALAKNLTISCRFAHESDMVRADADMIRRVLYNLLDNAVKFTADGGAVSVETTVAGEKVSVGVQDDGRGMTEDELKRVFDRFYKGDASRGEDKRGSGLGLSIVKEFIRAHGENIEVKSEPEKGSLFSFTLAAV